MKYTDVKGISEMEITKQKLKELQSSKNTSMYNYIVTDLIKESRNHDSLDHLFQKILKIGGYIPHLEDQSKILSFYNLHSNDIYYMCDCLKTDWVSCEGNKLNTIYDYLNLFINGSRHIKTAYDHHRLISTIVYRETVKSIFHDLTGMNGYEAGLYDKWLKTTI